MSIAPPRSERFDDVYYAHDGLAEKRTVFVEGCRLRSRWAGAPCFVVGELGFGTGLSMLATWQAASEHPGFVQFVSVEAHPLSRAEIARALSAFGELEEWRERLLALYPETAPGPGVHQIDLSERFVLTLWVGDVADALAEIDGAVDAWFLDGFAPAKNPAMWSPNVLDRIRSLCSSGATLSSYTAAGAVRRGLEERGFEVERVPGFANKRHRIVASYRGRGRRRSALGSVAIVGGGVAGACVARSLRRRGVRVFVFDADSERGASRNPRAMVAPRINRLDDPAARLQVRAFEYATRVYRDVPGFEAVGVLRLAVDDGLRDRFEKGLAAGPLRYGPSRWVSAREGSELAGVGVEHSGIWIPQGGMLAPAATLPTLFAGVERPKSDVRALELDRAAPAVRVHSAALDVQADALIVASGAWSRRWLPELPLRASRGQLSSCHGGALGARLRCVVSAHGYLSPPFDGVHLVGATYARTEELGPVAARPADDWSNIDKVRRWLPAVADELVPVRARASLRSNVPDHLPLAGRVGALYTLGALGSRGFTLAPLCAELVASEITGTVAPLDRAQRALISPERYLTP